MRVYSGTSATSRFPIDNTPCEGASWTRAWIEFPRSCVIPNRSRCVPARRAPEIIEKARGLAWPLVNSHQSTDDLILEAAIALARKQRVRAESSDPWMARSAIIKTWPCSPMSEGQPANTSDVRQRLGRPSGTSSNWGDESHEPEAASHDPTACGLRRTVRHRADGQRASTGRLATLRDNPCCRIQWSQRLHTASVIDHPGPRTAGHAIGPPVMPTRQHPAELPRLPAHTNEVNQARRSPHVARTDVSPAP